MLLPMMAMGGDMGEMGDILPMMLFTQMNGAGAGATAGANPMAQMMPMMMMMKMMGKGGGMGSMFGGSKTATGPRKGGFDFFAKNEEA
jgi:hypothetical protein